MQSSIQKLWLWPFYQFYNPKRIVIFCSIFLISTLFLNGSLSNLFFLVRQKARLIDQMQQMKVSSLDMEKKLLQAKDPQFITREAIEKFDMVSENDLVFIFPEE